MNTLTIFYDSNCGLCSRFRVWMEQQPKRVRTEFIDYRSAAAVEKFPDLPGLGADREVVVLADDGRWWQGSAAWITCLWATEHHHAWADHLASPLLLPLVKKAAILLSENRLSLSRILRLKADAELAAEIERIPSLNCDSEQCPHP